METGGGGVQRTNGIRQTKSWSVDAARSRDESSATLRSAIRVIDGASPERQFGTSMWRTKNGNAKLRGSVRDTGISHH